MCKLKIILILFMDYALICKFSDEAGASLSKIMRIVAPLFSVDLIITLLSYQQSEGNLSSLAIKKRAEEEPQAFWALIH